MVNWQEHGVPFLEFTEELTQHWINQGFTKQQTQAWLNVGLTAQDADFAAWLRDIKKKNVEWVLNHGQEEDLRAQCFKYFTEKEERTNNDIKTEENKPQTRNILLIGKTGNGKSTLANVLTRTNKFEEGESSVSVTEKVQIEEFEFDNITYRVIDTVGIGDTKLTNQEMLNRLRRAEHIIIREGLSQVLFVTSGRFAKEEIKAFDLLKVIFDENVGKYTTIVRTNFTNFNKLERCHKDMESILKQGGEQAKIIKGCNKFIHVDNPSLDTDDDDEMRTNLKKRENSRKKLLDHLKTYQKVYQPEFLVKFKKIIDELGSIEKEIKQGIDENSETLGNNIEQIEKFINERERIIKVLEEYEERVISLEKDKNIVDRLKDNITTSESGSYKLVQKNLKKEDKENAKKLSQSWDELINKNKDFKEKLDNLHSRFNDSEYKNQEIDKEKIEVIEKVIELAQQLQPEPNPNKLDRQKIERTNKIKYTKQQVIEYAQLAQQCYNLSNNDIFRLPNGWEFILSEQGSWDTFYALYSNSIKKELVLGIRGTNKIYNYLTNAGLVLGMLIDRHEEPPVTNEVKDFAKNILYSIKNFDQTVASKVNKSVLSSTYAVATNTGLNSASSQKNEDEDDEKLLDLENSDCINSIKKLGKSLIDFQQQKFPSFTFRIVGHSLGGVIAELCAVEFGMECITFESPGSLKILEGSPRHEGKPHYVVNFLSAPNIINTLNGHPGVIYRVKLPHTDGHSSMHIVNCITHIASYLEYGNIIKNASIAAGFVTNFWRNIDWLKRQHSIDNIVGYLQTNDPQLVEMDSWPKINYLSSWLKTLFDNLPLGGIIGEFRGDSPGIRTLITGEERMREAQIERLPEYQEKHTNVSFLLDINKMWEELEEWKARKKWLEQEQRKYRNCQEKLRAENDSQSSEILWQLWQAQIEVPPK